MDIFTADNGFALTGNSTSTSVEIRYGFRWVPLSAGSTVDPATAEVTVTFAPTATQTQFRNAIRSAMLAWANAMGHVIQRHLLADGTLVQP